MVIPPDGLNFLSRRVVTGNRIKGVSGESDCMYPRLTAASMSNLNPEEAEAGRPGAAVIGEGVKPEH